MRRRSVPSFEQLREGRARGVDVVLPRVGEVRKSPAQVAGERRVGRLVRLERAQHLEVERELARVRIEDAELALRQLDRGRLSAEEPVACELDVEFEDAGHGVVGEDGVGVVLVEPGGHAAVDPYGRLAVRLPQEVDALAAPVLGNGRVAAEPVRRPERPEPLAELDRPVPERLRLVPGDALHARGDEQLVNRSRTRVDRARGGTSRQPHGARQRDVQQRVLVAVAAPSREHLHRGGQAHGGGRLHLGRDPVQQQLGGAGGVALPPEDRPRLRPDARVPARDQRLRIEVRPQGGVARRQRVMGQ